MTIAPVGKAQSLTLSLLSKLLTGVLYVLGVA